MPSRDIDRIRDIIIEAVERPYMDDTGDGMVNMLNDLKLGDKYQLRLMEESGLIDGNTAKDGLFFVTVAGNDFYDAIRDDTIWKKTKDGAAKVGGLTLGMMADLAIGYLKQEAATKLGIEL